MVARPQNRCHRIRRPSGLHPPPSYPAPSLRQYPPADVRSRPGSVVYDPMYEVDATWFVRQDLEACQLPDEERDDEQHDHEGTGDEEDLTLLFRGCGDGTQPP